MKTKYWWLWLIGGIYLLFAGLGSLANINFGIPVFFIILGIITSIISLRLRKLKKKGIENSKKIIKSTKDKNKSGYCGWSTAALIFAFLGGWVGIILGIIALFIIKKNPNLRGKGAAIAAIIIAFPMMFVWTFFSILDPMALLPEESQASIYCKEECLEEQNLHDSYVEINPDNQSQYICSCLDSNYEVIAQYEVSLDYS